METTGKPLSAVTSRIAQAYREEAARLKPGTKRHTFLIQQAEAAERHTARLIEAVK